MQNQTQERKSITVVNEKQKEINITISNPKNIQAMINMASILDCNRLFSTNGSVTQKGKTTIEQINAILITAYMLSKKSIDESYIVHNITNYLNNFTITKGEMYEHDRLFQKLSSDSKLKQCLTAFELETLLKYDKKHQNKECDCHTKSNTNCCCSYFACMFNYSKSNDISSLKTWASDHTPSMDIHELFALLGCNKLLKTEKIQNDNLTHKGKKIYNKILAIIDIAIETFGYPDVKEQLNTIISKL